jgi:reactive intermediate/imine deaminase|tara:strand:+ start:3343 stop:3726 length:384 start_codon:yes stop_codon:yes gene_type:complete
MKKEYIHTEKAPSAIGAYSQAIKFENTIYLSGQIPLDPKNMILISDNIDKQIEQVFLNLSYVLQEAGSSLNDILKLNVYLTNLENFSKVNEHMEKIFDKPYPARAAIGIKELPKGALIEIDAIAAVI